MLQRRNGSPGGRTPNKEDARGGNALVDIAGPASYDSRVVDRMRRASGSNNGKQRSLLTIGAIICVGLMLVIYVAVGSFGGGSDKASMHVKVPQHPLDEPSVSSPTTEPKKFTVPTKPDANAGKKPDTPQKTVEAVSLGDGGVYIEGTRPNEPTLSNAADSAESPDGRAPGQARDAKDLEARKKAAEKGKGSGSNKPGASRPPDEEEPLPAENNAPGSVLFKRLRCVEETLTEMEVPSTLALGFTMDPQKAAPPSHAVLSGLYAEQPLPTARFRRPVLGEEQEIDLKKSEADDVDAQARYQLKLDLSNCKLGLLEQNSADFKDFWGEVTFDAMTGKSTVRRSSLLMVLHRVLVANAGQGKIADANKVGSPVVQVRPEEIEREVRVIQEAVGIVDLGSNGLSKLPDGFAFLFPNMHTLFLTKNELAQIPPPLARMETLTRLSLKQNKLVTIIPQKELPSSLVHLILTENQLISSPSLSFCFRFRRLRKLMLSGNKLTDIASLFSPGDFGREIRCELDSLELLRLSRNRIDKVASDGGVVVRNVPIRDENGRHLPRMDKSLSFFLRQLPRLSWISLAGNPIVGAKDVSIPIQARVLQVVQHLQDLSPDVKCGEYDGTALGEGASGIVVKCQMDLRPAGGGGAADTAADGAAEAKQLPVAVKFFKPISSDGAASDELYIIDNIPAEARETLLKAFGVVKADKVLSSVDPTLKEPLLKVPLAAVFPLIDGYVMGLPPTIVEVTRDRFLPVTPAERDILPAEKGNGPLAKSTTVRIAFPNEALKANPEAQEKKVRYCLSSRAIALLALDVAEGLMNLHKQGIAHGDLYAHNIFLTTQQHEQREGIKEGNGKNGMRGWLEDETANGFQHIRVGKYQRALVTDYGASFLYGSPSAPAEGVARAKEAKPLFPGHDDARAENEGPAHKPVETELGQAAAEIEAVEVRAFGVFVRDLMLKARCVSSQLQTKELRAEDIATKGMTQVIFDSTKPDLTTRPTFHTVVSQLQRLVGQYLSVEGAKQAVADSPQNPEAVAVPDEPTQPGAPVDEN